MIEGTKKSTNLLKDNVGSTSSDRIQLTWINFAYFCAQLSCPVPLTMPIYHSLYNFEQITRCAWQERERDRERRMKEKENEHTYTRTLNFIKIGLLLGFCIIYLLQIFDFVEWFFVWPFNFYKSRFLFKTTKSEHNSDRWNSVEWWKKEETNMKDPSNSNAGYRNNIALEKATKKKIK